MHMTLLAGQAETGVSTLSMHLGHCRRHMVERTRQATLIHPQLAERNYEKG
jgi:hypothetical protein